jgi:hypothetical protein
MHGLRNLLATDLPDEQLLHHYTEMVAPQMVWLHSAQNPFITIVLPLAFRSPALMMAILSVSAADLWTRRRDISIVDAQFSRRWELYQQRALRHLSAYLQSENEQSTRRNSRVKDHASPGLAAFLLSSLSLRMGSSRAWKLHVHAAWIMAEHANLPEDLMPSSPNDETLLLLAESYANKVWASVTNFEPIDCHWDVASLTSSTPFMRYVEIIRLLSELKMDAIRIGRLPPEAPSLVAIETMLYTARESTRASCKNLTVKSTAEAEALELVMEMFHHAGLIYASQVLVHDLLADNTNVNAGDRIFQHLQELIVTEVIAQDLTWPTFFAGTVSLGDLRKRSLVKAKMHEIMRLSGDLERQKLVAFLEDLWLLEDGDSSPCWLELAHQWASTGQPILII